MFERPDVYDLWGPDPTARPADPVRYWRQLCWATPTLAVSGDLHPERGRAHVQLAEWVAEGVTDVLDVREEDNDEGFVAQFAPHIEYHWLGVDDEGHRRDPRWFEEIVEITTPIVADPSRKLLVHCHLGVNRGPSAAFTVLYAHGTLGRDALDRIRTARPIASMMYSLDAVEWVAARRGLNHSEAREEYDDVVAWHRENPLDLPFVISRLGDRYAA